MTLRSMSHIDHLNNSFLWKLKNIGNTCCSIQYIMFIYIDNKIIMPKSNSIFGQLWTTLDCRERGKSMCRTIGIGRYKIDTLFEVFLNINEPWHTVKYIIIETNTLFLKKIVVNKNKKGVIESSSWTWSDITS